MPGFQFVTRAATRLGLLAAAEGRQYMDDSTVLDVVMTTSSDREFLRLFAADTEAGHRWLAI